MFTFTIKIEGLTVTNGTEVLTAIARMGTTEAETEKFQMGFANIEGGIEVTVQDILNDTDLEFLATGDYWMALQVPMLAAQARLQETGEAEDVLSDGDVVFGILEDLNVA